MRGHISLDERHGLLIQTDFTNKDLCKAIPGARWVKQVRAWCYPASPSSAKNIHLAFNGEAVYWTDAAAALLVEAEKIAQAAEMKLADDLAPIPLVKTQPWKHQAIAFWFVAQLWGGLPK